MKVEISGEKEKKCIKCGTIASRYPYSYIIKHRDTKFINYDGPFWCKKCDDDFCDECGSHDITAYDDGEGYPPNLLCNGCGHWPQ